jgi:hypothetical protein
MRTTNGRRIRCSSKWIDLPLSVGAEARRGREREGKRCERDDREAIQYPCHRT